MICPRCGSRREHAECRPADVRRWEAYARRVERYHASPAYVEDMVASGWSRERALSRQAELAGVRQLPLAL